MQDDVIHNEIEKQFKEFTRIPETIPKDVKIIDPRELEPKQETGGRLRLASTPQCDENAPDESCSDPDKPAPSSQPPQNQPLPPRMFRAVHSLSLNFGTQPMRGELRVKGYDPSWNEMDYILSLSSEPFLRNSDIIAMTFSPKQDGSPPETNGIPTFGGPRVTREQHARAYYSRPYYLGGGVDIFNGVARITLFGAIQYPFGPSFDGVVGFNTSYRSRLFDLPTMSVLMVPTYATFSGLTPPYAVGSFRLSSPEIPTDPVPYYVSSPICAIDRVFAQYDYHFSDPGGTVSTYGGGGSNLYAGLNQTKGYYVQEEFCGTKVELTLNSRDSWEWQECTYPCTDYASNMTRYSGKPPLKAEAIINCLEPDESIRLSPTIGDDFRTFYWFDSSCIRHAWKSPIAFDPLNIVGQAASLKWPLEMLREGIGLEFRGLLRKKVLPQPWKKWQKLG